MTVSSRARIIASGSANPVVSRQIYEEAAGRDTLRVASADGAEAGPARDVDPPAPGPGLETEFLDDGPGEIVAVAPCVEQEQRAGRIGGIDGALLAFSGDMPLRNHRARRASQVTRRLPNRSRRSAQASRISRRGFK